MTTESEDDRVKSSASRQIENIWYRARINAFAHRFRMEYLSKKDTINYTLNILFTLLSILFTIILYIVLINTSKEEMNVNGTWAAVIITLLSIIFTFLGLYFTIMASHKRFAILCAEHKFLLNSYQYIAQRAREAKWPEKPKDEVIELLRDLERDFSLLKARGSEPTNDDFVKAGLLMKKIQDNPTENIAQSYPNVEPLD